MTDSDLVPGAMVRLRSDPSRGGLLLEGTDPRMASVRLMDGSGVSRFPRRALEAVPEHESMADRFATGRFVHPDELRRVFTRLRVTGRLSDVFYSMEATATDFYPHQFKPVVKLMSSPTDALLIADEVGVGKTIEAGLIWTELRARLDYERLLVVCPKTLCRKWQDELDTRFNVQAQIGDAATLLGALKSARGGRRGFALVCSMQGLRPPKDWGASEAGDQKRRGARRDLARYLDEQGDGEPLIDLVVFDEAHHMRNPDTMLHRFGKLANAVSAHRLFLSATPIHLRNRDLHSLLSMVDPDTFAFPETLQDLIETNAPIVKARDVLLHSDSSAFDILDLLSRAKASATLRHSKSLQQIHSAVATSELSRSERSELAARLERVNQLANYVTRTRRRDVEEHRVIREPKAPELTMAEEEKRFYSEISDVVGEYAREKAVNEPFLLASPQRLLSSSLAAASHYWCGSMRGGEEETDDDLDGRKWDDRPLVREIVRRARELGLTDRLSKADTKYALLKRELNELWRGDVQQKVILFSSFIPTLHYLQDRLSADEIQTELLHGTITRPRAEVLERFQTDPCVRVLLSSEVGSEGIDLQFSSTVVNYDLPWNPMRLEQRIGRVDRLGQTSKKVLVLNLIYGDTIDRRIYDRLFERLEIGRQALGAMESVLGKPIRDMTRKLLDPQLTLEQQEAIIDQAALALENRRQAEEQLESDAAALVHHGDYILQSIAESRDRGRWLKEDDILTYVRDRLLHDFPGTVIEASPPGSDTYRIDLSVEAATAFRDFLQRSGMQGQTRLLGGTSRHRYRFTSSIVERSSQFENISQLHPVVRFAAQRERRSGADGEAPAVATRVGLDAMPEGCSEGLYVLAASRWSFAGPDSSSEASVRIGYAGAEVVTGRTIGADLAERMMVVAASQDWPLLNASMHERLKDAATALERVMGELDGRFGEFCEQITAEMDDRIEVRKRSLDRHFSEKIRTEEEHVRNLEIAVRLAEAQQDAQRARNLRNLIRAREAKAEKLDRTWKERAHRMDLARESTPEESKVGCVFLEVAAEV